ncbi:hypothetical protein, partial [Acinetobacter baumannii]|uniref:hypothetical protein n=1 Tax=Acinetobacter baumannii TaxID=470 RepID=UPI001C072CAC
IHLMTLKMHRMTPTFQLIVVYSFLQIIIKNLQSVNKILHIEAILKGLKGRPTLKMHRVTPILVLL